MVASGGFMSSLFCLLKASGPGCCWRWVLLSRHQWAPPWMVPHPTLCYFTSFGLVCRGVWGSETAELQKGGSPGLREQGRALPRMAPTPVLASGSMAGDHRWGPKSAWVYCEHRWIKVAVSVHIFSSVDGGCWCPRWSSPRRGFGDCRTHSGEAVRGGSFGS